MELGPVPKRLEPDNNQKDSYLLDPDVLLMLEFQKGDMGSFEALMRTYFPRVFNFVYRYVNNRELAEDLSQEVFMRVYKSVGRYKPTSKLQTWLFTIARNLSLNELRRNKHKMFSLDEPVACEDGEMVRPVEDPQPHAPDEQMIRDERAAAVKAAIHELPENQRVAVLLRRYEEFSYEDIAKTMTISVKAVKSLLSRAKENLRIRLLPGEEGENNSKLI